MNELERQLRERETKDLQHALGSDTLTVDAADIARTILREREASIPNSIAVAKDLEGIGGWLILVGIGIILTPIGIITQFLSPYSKIFSDGSWEALTTPGTAFYNPLFAPIFWGETAINIGQVLFWVFVAFLFFSKKKIFPKCYIGILLFGLTFILADSFAFTLVFKNASVFDAETSKEFARLLIVTMIWAPYMLFSRRVKSTFVK